MELEINRLSSGAVELRPLGALDETNLTQLRNELLDHAPTMAERVLLNLSGVDRVDTAAMALLMLARIEIEARGGAFVVESPRPPVKGTMERAGFTRFVTVAER